MNVKSLIRSGIEDLRAHKEFYQSPGVLYEEQPNPLLVSPFVTIIATGLGILGMEIINFGLLAIFGVLFIVLFISTVFSYAFYSGSNLITINSREIIWREGFLSSNKRRVNMKSVRSAEVSQSPIQRIFNHGNLIIWSSGDQHSINVNGLPGASKLNRIIAEYTTQES